VPEILERMYDLVLKEPKVLKMRDENSDSRAAKKGAKKLVSGVVHAYVDQKVTR
jgi:hypothetical protein